MENKLNNKLKLSPNCWYAWQMVPGYVGERSVPYCSPIYMRKVTPKKTGKNILNIEFYNAFYAQGVQDFSLDVRVLKHCKDYMIVELLYGGGDNERSAVISHIEFQWIQQFCPDLWRQYPLERTTQTGSVSIYLDTIFVRGSGAS